MITASDSFNTVDFGPYFAILPQSARYSIAHYCDLKGCKRVTEGYAYNSGTNPNFLTVLKLRDLIREHVDPKFIV